MVLFVSDMVHKKLELTSNTAVYNNPNFHAPIIHLRQSFYMLFIQFIASLFSRLVK